MPASFVWTEGEGLDKRLVRQKITLARLRTVTEKSEKASACRNPRAFSCTIFRCAENGKVLYRNFPCPSESDSKIWVRTDVQVSAPSPAGNSPTTRDEPRMEARPAPGPAENSLTTRDEPRVESPAAPSENGSPLAARGVPRIGMTTKEVRAMWGEPTEITQEEVVQGRVQTWSYGASRSVQFDHTGRLSVMQP